MRNGHVRHGSYAMLHSTIARCRHVALVILGPPAIIHARHTSLSSTMQGRDGARGTEREH